MDHVIRTFHVERVRFIDACSIFTSKHILSVKVKHAQHQMLQDREQLDYKNEMMCGEKAEIMRRLLILSQVALFAKPSETSAFSLGAFTDTEVYL